MSGQLFLIAYDISSTRKRNQLIKILKKYGTRLQWSLFQFELSEYHKNCMIEEISEFYKKSKAAKEHLKNKRFEIMIIPMCKSCHSKRIAFGEDMLMQMPYLIF